LIGIGASRFVAILARNLRMFSRFQYRNMHPEAGKPPLAASRPALDAAVRPVFTESMSTAVRKARLWWRTS
jgi:hypothetical protein